MFQKVEKQLESSAEKVNVDIQKFTDVGPIKMIEEASMNK